MASVIRSCTEWKISKVNAGSRNQTDNSPFARQGDVRSSLTLSSPLWPGKFDFNWLGTVKFDLISHFGLTNEILNRNEA